MGWLDCHSQFLGGAVALFTDLNCTCPFWDDGMTAILNVYNGKVLGNEVMPTLNIVKMLRPPPRQMCMSHVHVRAHMCGVGRCMVDAWVDGRMGCPSPTRVRVRALLALAPSLRR